MLVERRKARERARHYGVAEVEAVAFLQGRGVDGHDAQQIPVYEESRPRGVEPYPRELFIQPHRIATGAFTTPAHLIAQYDVKLCRAPRNRFPVGSDRVQDRAEAKKVIRWMNDLPRSRHMIADAVGDSCMTWIRREFDDF